jgi:hypothetical protein
MSTVRHTARIFAAALIVSLAFWAPAFLHWDETGFGDWQWFHHMWEAGRVSLLRDGELPFWNPHLCGGMSHWGNPQAQVFSPFWWVTGLPFGTTLGHKLYIVLHSAIGVTGMFLLARREYALAAPAAATAAAIWCFSAVFAWDGSGGHSTFLSFYFAPWLLLAWRRAGRDLRYAAAVAVILGLTLAEAATYPPPYFLLLLAFDSLAQARHPGGTWRVVRAAAVAGPLTLLVSAYRLIAVVGTLGEHPRPTTATDAMSWEDVLLALTAREHDWVFHGHQFVWPEYAAFIGWSALGLAGLGVVVVVVVRRRGTLHLAVGALLFTMYAMGGAETWFPWSLTHHLPVYGSLRVPSRFMVFATFYLALLAAVAIDALQREAYRVRLHRWFRWLRPALIAVVCCVCVWELVSATVPLVDRWRGAPLVAMPLPSPFALIHPVAFKQEYANYPRRNVGTPYCYEVIEWNVAPRLWVGETAQVRMADRSEGEIHAWTRTTNAFSVEVTLPAPARVHFNTNYTDDWSSNVGLVASDEGLLAVDLPAGTHSVRVVMTPRDWPWSPLVSFGGLLLCAGLVSFGGGRRRSSSRRDSPTG